VQELHNRANTGRAGQYACHGRVMFKQVVDLQSFFAAQSLCNESRSQQIRGLRRGGNVLPTMLSTATVD
jgi:hypothetical protein